LKYGNGDLHWFAKLPREDQAVLIAYETLERDPKAGARATSGGDVLAAHLARIERKKAGLG